MTGQQIVDPSDGPAPCATTDALANNDEVAFPPTFYPPADITPVQFEEFVVELLKSMEAVAGAPPVVTLHEKVEGIDGEYDFDATARFDWGGMQSWYSPKQSSTRTPSGANSSKSCTTNSPALELRRPSCFRPPLISGVL